MLETKDLLLRPGKPEDGAVLYENLWRHEAVFRFMFSRPSPNEAHRLKRTTAYAEMHQSFPTEFFVCEKATGSPIGIAGLKELAPGCWTITDTALGPDFWGKGYGTQIVTALSELAFEKLGAQELRYECFAENLASHRLALACGFAPSYTAEAELEKDGQRVMMEHFVLHR